MGVKKRANDKWDNFCPQFPKIGKRRQVAASSCTVFSVPALLPLKELGSKTLDQIRMRRDHILIDHDDPMFGGLAR